MGTLYQRGNVWWIQYYRNGRAFRESAKTPDKDTARDLLRIKEGDAARGLPIAPRVNQATFDELAADVITDYKVNGQRSLSDAERRFNLHLLPVFGGWRATNITTVDFRRYTLARQAAKATNGTINRELAMAKRAFILGMDAGKITFRPKVPMLRENNVRAGFFERAQFEAVRRHLPDELQNMVTFAYITGWRTQSEVQRLQWRQVDFEAGTVRLEAGTTKNGEARVFPFTRELRALLEAQRAYTDAVQRERGIICPHVFHRNGKPILYFRKSWKNACKLAGCPDRLGHDFRRTAVRNLVRAGIPERVAMTMTGHKTRSVFERYNLVSPGDLTEAARKLDLADTVPTQSAPEASLASAGELR